MSALVGAAEARVWVRVPSDDDDKYSRGVVGFVTGSPRYPGAAVLGVEAALRTGVGMVRYLGPGRATRLVLQHRPEAVTSAGRVQAWVVGSGQEKPAKDELGRLLLDTAFDDGMPVVLDAGALEARDRARGPVVLTPHAGELARLLGVERDVVLADRDAFARRAADELDATVLLKGAETLVAAPGVATLRVRNATPWLATAGAGDALAGVLGALVATNHARLELAPITAAAAWIHGEAARRASAGGPFTILDLCAHLPGVVADLASMSA